MCLPQRSRTTEDEKLLPQSLNPGEDTADKTEEDMSPAVSLWRHNNTNSTHSSTRLGGHVVNSRSNWTTQQHNTTQHNTTHCCLRQASSDVPHFLSSLDSGADLLSVQSDAGTFHHLPGLGNLTRVRNEGNLTRVTGVCCAPDSAPRNSMWRMRGAVQVGCISGFVPKINEWIRFYLYNIHKSQFVSYSSTRWDICSELSTRIKLLK